MTYTGEVSVGGPADSREIDGLTVTKLAVGPYDNNAYLLRCTATGVGLLIDAAAEPDRLIDLIGADGLAAIVTTHQHGDHWQALAQVRSHTGGTTYAGREDTEGIPVPTDIPVDDDTIRFGDAELTAIHLVGHTPGSIALLYREPGGAPHLFTGDCLFPGGVGNTQKDPERFATLYHDVSTKLFGQLPDETWVYPGHGRDTTLGAERPHLEEWRTRGW